MQRDLAWKQKIETKCCQADYTDQRLSLTFEPYLDDSYEDPLYSCTP